MNQTIHLISKQLNHVTNTYATTRYVSIAPEKKQVDAPDIGIQKYVYKNSAQVGVQTASIARRNARERNRVKQVNDSFNALRRRLPGDVVAALSRGARRSASKKLSKVDTLRMVVEYIKHLESLIEYSDDNGKSSSNFAAYENEADERLMYGSSSPYSESVPSPVSSDCSTGLSSVQSADVGHAYGYQTIIEDQLSAMEDVELFDSMSWWQK